MPARAAFAISIAPLYCDIYTLFLFSIFPVMNTKYALGLLASFSLSSLLGAGSYAPEAGQEGSTAIAASSEEFAGWVTTVVSYTPGDEVEPKWTDTDMALGEPVDDVSNVVVLGRGGNIVVSFDDTIYDGEGWDFAVFENAFDGGFLELAYVEVSSNGQDYVRFPCHSETPSAVGAYANNMDASNIDGLASKYMLGYGTPFDLSDLEGVSGAENLDLSAINYVRIVDIVGDGTSLDSDGNPIYDPYPTVGSAGFDLNAVGVRYFTPESGWTETWFGNAYLFSYEGETWVYSVDSASYLYVVPGNDYDGYFYDQELGWYYTKAESYSYMYLYDLDQWVYFYTDTDLEGRWFFIWDESLQESVELYPYATASELANATSR